MKILGKQISKDKKSVVLIFFIFFVVLGTYTLIVNGILKVINAGTEPELAKIASSNQPFPINDSRTEFVANSNISIIHLLFNTTDVFSVAKSFDFIINATVINPKEIDKIIALPLEADVNMTILKNKTQTQKIVDNVDKKFLTTLLLDNKTNSSFIGSRKNIALTSEGDLIFMLLSYKNGKIIQEVPVLREHPLKIYPRTAELQVYTDRDLRQQIIESTKTNDVITGLTWIIVGLIPIGFVVEFLIEYAIEHHYFRKNKSENSTNFSRLDENPNYYRVG